MDSRWEEKLGLVRGMWNGEADMDETPLGLLVANAVVSYLGGMMVYNTGTEKLACDFECFLVDTTSATSAYVGRAEPDMRPVAFTVMSIMSCGGAADDDNVWKQTLINRFASADAMCWAMLAGCKEEGVMLLLVPKTVVQWWTCSDRVKDQCPAGMMQALEKSGELSRCPTEAFYNYAAMVPFVLLSKSQVMMS